MTAAATPARGAREPACIPAVRTQPSTLERRGLGRLRPDLPSESPRPRRVGLRASGSASRQKPYHGPAGSARPSILSMPHPRQEGGGCLIKAPTIASGPMTNRLPIASLSMAIARGASDECRHTSVHTSIHHRVRCASGAGFNHSRSLSCRDLTFGGLCQWFGKVAMLRTVFRPNV